MPVLARLVSFLLAITFLAAPIACSPSSSTTVTPPAGAPAAPTSTPTTGSAESPVAAKPTLVATPTIAASPTPTSETIVDDAGRTVVIPRAPQRIVSIAPSNTEILYALDLGDRIVGVDEFSNYPPEVSQKPRVGSYFQPSLEQIVAVSPDLVLATSLHVGEIVPALEARNVTTVVVAPDNLDETLDWITRIGQITGQEDRAERLTRELGERIDAVEARIADAPRTRVFFELSPELHTVGPGNFVDDLIARAGGENVATDADSEWPQLNQEALIAKDPEVILLSDAVAGVTVESVRERPGWQSVSAVRQGRIIIVDPDLTTRPGPRIVDGLEALATALHPDRFDEQRSSR